MRRTCLLTLALACAAPAAMAAEAAPIRLTIAAGQVDEICLPLRAGDTLAWRFRSNAPLDFNLHHHVGDQVVMPVSRKAVAHQRARHTADRDNEWCLMWTAPAAQAVTVNGDWHIRRARKR